MADMPFAATLPLSSQKIARCRKIAEGIGKQVMGLVQTHSTVGIERGILRLLSVDGAQQRDLQWYPNANIVLDQLTRAGKREQGVLYWVANAMVATGHTLPTLEKEIEKGKLNLAEIPEQNFKKIQTTVSQLAKAAVRQLGVKRKARLKLRKGLKDPAHERRPVKYVIVATGNIFEDVIQGKSAAEDGADAIAVIRSTAQSLLDYVPHGTTTEGFGGTYATQANFKVMREGLDAIGAQLGRYIRLTNYCSGLCMSEIAALAAQEGLDYLLNDAMYGILFRDINMKRTLLDQHFSRAICAFSDITIMTGEDNYLKTTDAKETGHQVLASQFINERAGWNAGLKNSQMAIGHAMEMDPSYDQVLLWEIARAQMTRQIFPKAPLKYMCNTKYKTGDIFTGHAIDTIFNFIGTLTNQGVILLGMPTEAIHTPWLQDRSLALRSANYMVGGGRELAQEMGYLQNGRMAKYAQEVLDATVAYLEKIGRMGVFQAIEKGFFADVKRPLTGGKGADGVFEKDPKRYLNPFPKLMEQAS